MNKKLNCWDSKMCCNETENSIKKICPVKKESIANGLNGGINAGRICWVIMDSHCKQKARTACYQCEFHYKVKAEEGLLNNCNAIGTYLGKLETNNSKIRKSS